MGQFNLIRLLLLPSFLSGLLTVVATLGIMGASAWLYISGGLLFYEPLFGSLGVVTILVQAPDVFAVVREVVFDNTITYGLLIVVCAILIGLLVFAVLQGVSRVTRETSVVWYEFHLHTPAAQRAVRESLTRLAIRSLSVVCWALYGLLVGNFLLPFCILLLQAGLDLLESAWAMGAALSLLATLFMLLGLHLNVVFLRLCLLRPRVLRGYAFERAALESK